MEQDNPMQSQPRRRRYHPATETSTQTNAAPIPSTPESTPLVSETSSVQPHLTAEAKHNAEFSYTEDNVLKKPYTPKRVPSNSHSYQYPSPYSSQHTEQTGRPPHASVKSAIKKRLPYYLGIILCSVVLVASGSMLIRYYGQIHHANTATNELRELYREQETAISSNPPTPTPTPSPVPSAPEATSISVEIQATEAPLPTAADDFLSKWPSKYPGNEQMRIHERFTPLRQQNRDVVGWLSIEDVLDEPVFQRDNSYYLTHDATGTKNPTGALFLDENCNLRTVPMQVLIHGHNMKEGAMFGSLKKYKVKDASFYREHPFIHFDSLYESATYVIFAVAEVNIVAGNTHYFPFWHQFHFEDYESFRQYVSLAKEYSRFKVNIDVQPGDRLLTLATCSSGDDNLRLIVMARMLRENEDTSMLTNQIYSATAK